ncbi:hypothetical protein B9Z19DRAFT_1130366 [Tuber borchii]|uniref:Uncharacterized protein n=1 Tax=Tuber borchii TaxID=42251 RepID=A0A2T6ZKM5_TUBBO|nr:hypothetical protein B9Z19DRAFT_1130366 [Tuber borchii]
MLRTEVYLGEARNIVVWLYPAGDSRILEAIGETDYPHLVPGETRSLLIKADPGNPTAFATTHINARDPTGNQSSVEQHINLTQANLGVYETSVLNGLGARLGPEDGLPRALDRTGRQNIPRPRPRPRNLKTAVIGKDDGPGNLRY